MSFLRGLSRKRARPLFYFRLGPDLVVFGYPQSAFDK